MSLTKSQVESIVRNTITEYVSETTVSGKMKAYVMNEERKMLIAAGMDGFLSESIQAYEEAYQELIREGREENRKTKHLSLIHL